MRTLRPRLRSAPALSLLLLLVAGAAGVAYAIARPASTNWFAFHVTHRLPGSLADFRACLCRPDQDLRLRRADGLELAAGLYLPSGREAGERRHRAILLLHGNTPAGHELPFYRVLASELAERDYVVLAPDFAGYGDSEDPFRLGSLEALRQDADALTGLLYLRQLPGAAREMMVIGHSGGANAALAIGLREPDVGGIALIGPPRRDPELLFDVRSVEVYWQRERDTHREVYGTDLPGWFTREDWNAGRVRKSIERYVPELARPGHKPLLLMDGGRESSKDRKYLAAYYQRLVEPKAYMTIPDSDHYANSWGLLNVSFYDAKAVRLMVDDLDRWMRKEERSSLAS